MADGTSRSSAYLRVASTFRERIADGTWPAGYRLPSRGTLGAELGVGENIIRRAQEILTAEGLLEGRAGSGTYVRATYERRTMLRTETHRTPGLLPAGFDGTWEANSIAKVPAPSDIASRLGIATDDLCVRTAYEVLANRQPVMLITSWEPMAVTDRTVIVLPEGGPLAGRGVVARMAHIGITVARVVEVPRPIHLDEDQAQVLGLPTGSQALLIARTYYDTSGRAVETADIVVPPERWDVLYDVPVPAAGQPS
ncbi:GntR family transcriptional regulator [Streptantibioticus ferralitis]|uniref:GntR family transcriptional regulator n=1 Tax=Streptantibioticus ferralitis TaxID=236510 RepID=A0ABT5ZAN9_9ACTN|nr:GntR family transcriptional regulator [Streptantibioticus ferralitis]MDF2260906.1 GntR family transcriptional regulator [Streptantibioticus ferralitis]